MATKRWSSKVTWIRSGSLRGSIYWVLLVSGRVCLSKTIIPEAQEHFLTPLARRDTQILSVDWGLGPLRGPSARIEGIPLRLP